MNTTTTVEPLALPRHAESLLSSLNLRGGWALIAGTWTRWLQLRLFFFILFFGWMIPPLTYLFVWSSIAGSSSIEGMDRGAFVTYYLTLLAVDHVTRTENHYHVGVKIHDGSMAALLLRPIPAVYEAIASDLASKIVGSLTIIPFLIGLALLLRPDVAIAPDRFLLFIPSVALAWALAFSWTYWLSLTAFWLTHVSGIFRLHHAMMFVFGGQVAPLPVLPEALGMVAQVLPYRYMAAFPVEILIGQVDGQSLAVGFAWQLGWVIVSVALSVLLWRQGVRQYAAVGA